MNSELYLSLARAAVAGDIVARNALADYFEEREDSNPEFAAMIREWSDHIRQVFEVIAKPVTPKYTDSGMLREYSTYN